MSDELKKRPPGFEVYPNGGLHGELPARKGPGRETGGVEGEMNFEDSTLAQGVSEEEMEKVGETPDTVIPKGLGTKGSVLEQAAASDKGTSYTQKFAHFFEVLQGDKKVNEKELGSLVSGLNEVAGAPEEKVN